MERVYEKMSQLLKKCITFPEEVSYTVLNSFDVLIVKTYQQLSTPSLGF